MPSKLQDANKDGELDYPGFPGDETYRLKDDVPYGTYIEVDAYYVSVNSEKVGRGPIKYRFMLVRMLIGIIMPNGIIIINSR